MPRNWLVLPALAGLIVLGGCHRPSGPPAMSASAPSVSPPGVSDPAPDEAISLTSRQIVEAEVAVAPVVRRPISTRVLAPGQVAYDEARLAHVTAWTAGRLDALMVDTTGETIAQGEVMARIYSPELFSGEQDYVSALAMARQLGGAPYAAVAGNARDLVTASRERLALLGITPSQLAALDTGATPDPEVAIHAPASGVVIRKYVQVGQYVKTGDLLYDVADLSTVWVEAEVPEAAIGGIRLGDAAAVTLVAYPGRTFHGQVSFVYPFLDADTRSVRVRIVLSNPDGLLKPEMYATVSLSSAAAEALVVPSSAVVDTGRSQIVWVQIAPGQYLPHAVTVGPADGDRVPVLFGLHEGQQVVVSGGYLLDSSARLQGIPLPRATR